VRANSFPDVNSRQLRAVLAVAEYRSFIAALPCSTRGIMRLESTSLTFIATTSMARRPVP
jgi:hypothetical protein